MELKDKSSAAPGAQGDSEFYTAVRGNAVHQPAMDSGHAPSSQIQEVEWSDISCCQGGLRDGIEGSKFQNTLSRIRERIGQGYRSPACARHVVAVCLNHSHRALTNDLHYAKFVL